MSHPWELTDEEIEGICERNALRNWEGVLARAGAKKMIDYLDKTYHKHQLCGGLYAVVIPVGEWRQLLSRLEEE
ncbi:MAG: hypothetical protein SVY53_03255 [Chloroflexota bacterium]|nr:hypothetical protein [Chloroflexota bacterium]